MRDRVESPTDHAWQIAARGGKYPAPLCRVGHALQRGHVGARAERRSGARQYHRTQIAIVSHLANDRLELGEHLEVQAIATLGPIERDRRNRPVDFVKEARFHRWVLRPAARWPDRVSWRLNELFAPYYASVRQETSK